jgi:hypothetical protein
MHRTRKSFPVKLILICVGLSLALMPAGCVERRLTINTEPAGALVWLNDEEIGASPVTVEFNWYGDYKVRVSKEGYETLNTHRKLEAPLHDGFPIDFFAEVIWPGRIVDEYEWSFRLQEYQPPQHAELIDAAQQMKQTAAAEFEEGLRQQAEEQKTPARRPR